MDNETIIQTLKLTASLMELHDENPFKIKSLQSSLFKLDQVNEPLAELSPEKLETLDGVGKSLAGKISEIAKTGSHADLQELITKTPQGVIEMLGIKGIGPKKVRAVWKELDITSKEALLEACNANKVSALKGFGEKTQEAIKQALEFSEQHKDKFLYAEAETIANELEKLIQSACPEAEVSISAKMRRRIEVIDYIQFIIGSDFPLKTLEKISKIPALEMDVNTSGPFVWRGKERSSGIKVEVKAFAKNEFAKKLFLNTCDPKHLRLEAKPHLSIGHIIRKAEFVTEQDFYQQLGMHYIEPEMREGFNEVQLAKEGKLPELLKDSDLKGILHNHSTYSDGSHTLEQMASYCKELGYEYLGISDHSQTAFYANGLRENRVFQQHAEIDELNKKLAPFKIFKGIESDILNDGSLDYEDKVLASFDFIVASIHSNLKMKEEKAMERLIKAIENPYTTMLGHPTGRLLLKREGYPIDHKKVIDACVANNVIIEINAHPLRLDMDWRYISYALEKGAWISVNPDAHSMSEYHNMRYGVLVGRKAGLSKEHTFNALPLAKVEEHFAKKKSGE